MRGAYVIIHAVRLARQAEGALRPNTYVFLRCLKHCAKMSVQAHIFACVIIHEYGLRGSARENKSVWSTAIFLNLYMIRSPRSEEKERYKWVLSRQL